MEEVVGLHISIRRNGGLLVALSQRGINLPAGNCLSEIVDSAGANRKALIVDFSAVDEETRISTDSIRFINTSMLNLEERGWHILCIASRNASEQTWYRNLDTNFQFCECVEDAEAQERQAGLWD